MGSLTVRGIPDDLLIAAKARARERGEHLNDLITCALIAYVNDQSTRQQFAASGGHARASRMTPEQRSEAARRAVAARWARFKRAAPESKKG